MDPKKPNKGVASATSAESGASTEETPHPQSLEQLRNDQQALIAVLEKEADASDAFARCLDHLDTIDRLIVPVLKKANVPEPELRRTLVRHDLARVLLADLRYGRQDEESRNAKQAVLAQLMAALGKQEVADDSGIFALAAAKKADLEEIAPKIATRKGASPKQAETKQPRTPALSILRLDMFGRQHDIPSEEYPMARYQNDRPRDDDGRFTSGSSGGRYDRDDDRRYAGGGYGDRDYRDDRSYGYGRDDDDGRRYGGGNDRFRDDQGRFASDDDYRGSRGNRYENDDRRYGRDDDDDRGRGWQSDARGRAEASRRHDYDDDRGYNSRGRSSGNDRSRDDQGRFTSDDDRNYSSRGRSSGNDRLRDDQGRFASDDDRRYGSRHRDDDDSRRGHGGWFGDPRGHAEASRRGWENRR
ncbi:hypothetical protein [Niveispirillum sp. KHB5.9]|uniref:hypothetical protein n=1 Tax=Niveispirillum sp. KHB5.9 TaxID=3400269 RepID=UPI003A87FC78